MPIIAKHHTLLSTLLITNAVALEALPICIDKIVPSWLAILISAVGVVIVAEIVPMSVCTGPRKYQIAAFCGPFVNILMCFLWCLATPSGKILDWLLGGHSNFRYKKKDLKALIELH
jgi:metal transporter CNNM